MSGESCQGETMSLDASYINEINELDSILIFFYEKITSIIAISCINEIKETVSYLFGSYEKTISTLAIVISLYVAFTCKKELKWYRVNKTFDFIDFWTGEHMTKIREKIRQNIDYENKEPVEMDKLLGLKNYHEISNCLISLLNFLDSLCIAYMNGFVDKEIIYNYFGNVLVNHYIILEPFIHHLRGKLDKSDIPELATYRHLEKVANRWIKQIEEDSRANPYPVYKNSI